MLRIAVTALALVVACSLSGCADRSGAATAISVSATPVPVTVPTPTAGVSDEVAVIGALPKRTSLLLHGKAPLPSLGPATVEDLSALARSKGISLDDAIRDYGYQESFDTIAESAASDPGYSDAVFHPGEHEASELRFTDRPPDEFLDSLQAQYPRDLRIEWGERLGGDRARDTLSETVFDIVHTVPATGQVTTGIDGDGRLEVEFDGSASPRAVADAIVAAPAFRKQNVDGRPPTEVRIIHVAPMHIDDLTGRG